MVRKIGPLPVLCLVILLSAPVLFAQDSHTSPAPDRLRAQAASHSGSSPFNPPDEDDTLFVSDTGGGLDTGCTFRTGGPLRIKIEVKRYVGPISGNGYLTDPQGLVSRGLLTPKAKLILPVFDIDVNGAPGLPPEVDRIFFNGHDLGTLSGDNNIWKQNSFEVPIEWVKFPAQGAPGSTPTPANNELVVSIDEASGGQENWCMSVDWVEIKFGAIAPILLVHGTNANSTSWDPNFTAFFRGSRAPWSNDINLTPNGSILGNGRELANRVRQLARSFGAKKVHLIGHSKGGLDTRAYLNNNYDPRSVKVLSVYTLGTPHHGTIVSDIIVARRTTVDAESSDPNISYLMNNDYWFLSTPQPPAINNQMTTSMARFNATYPNVPSGVKFYNYGADADLNNDGRIAAAETEPLIPASTPNFIAAAAGNAMYNAIGRIAAISVTPGARWFGLNRFTSIEVASYNNVFHYNDLVTSIESAVSPGGNYLGTRNGNHSSMKSAALAQQILNRIKSDYPIR
jgi:triacylglycerol lipase